MPIVTSTDFKMSSAAVPPAAAAAATSDVESDEEDILVWGQEEDEPDLSVNHLIRHVKCSHDYADAVNYLGVKEYGAPKTVEDMKKVLQGLFLFLLAIWQ